MTIHRSYRAVCAEDTIVPIESIKVGGEWHSNDLESRLTVESHALVQLCSQPSSIRYFTSMKLHCMVILHDGHTLTAPPGSLGRFGDDVGTLIHDSRMSRVKKEGEERIQVVISGAIPGLLRID